MENYFQSSVHVARDTCPDTASTLSTGNTRTPPRITLQPLPCTSLVVLATRGIAPGRDTDEDTVRIVTELWHDSAEMLTHEAGIGRNTALATQLAGLRFTFLISSP